MSGKFQGQHTGPSHVIHGEQYASDGVRLECCGVMVVDMSYLVRRWVQGMFALGCWECVRPDARNVRAQILRPNPWVVFTPTTLANSPRC